MKDYFEIKNKQLLQWDKLFFGHSMEKKIIRKWYNPFRYLMKRGTTKRIHPRSFITNTTEY